VSGLSQDAAKRRKQLANLKPDAAVKTGIYSKTLIEPLRERFFAESVEAYPGESEDELWILAQRKAMAHQIATFIDARGVVRHQRRGEPFPVASLLAKLMDSIERQVATLEERKRERAAAPALTLADVVAEIEEARANGE